MSSFHPGWKHCSRFPGLMSALGTSPLTPTELMLCSLSILWDNTHSGAQAVSTEQNCFDFTEREHKHDLLVQPAGKRPFLFPKDYCHPAPSDCKCCSAWRASPNPTVSPVNIPDGLLQCKPPQAIALPSSRLSGDVQGSLSQSLLPQSANKRVLY